MTRSPSGPLALLLVVSALLLGAPRATAALDEPGRLWLVAQRAFEDRLNGVARVSLERLVERYPQDGRYGDALLLLGKVRFAEGALEPALTAFRQARTITPPPGEPQEARFWEAETLFRLGRYDAARGAYEGVVAADAASKYAPDSLYGLAWSELELKHRDPAINAFRQLVSAFPDHATVPSATYYLARALVDAKRYDEPSACCAAIPSVIPSPSTSRRRCTCRATRASRPVSATRGSPTCAPSSPSIRSTTSPTRHGAPSSSGF
jgi:TolA-binding protein